MNNNNNKNNNNKNNNKNKKNNNNKQSTNNPKNTQVKTNKKIVTTTIKNQFLSKLFSPTTSIKEIIENLDEINKLSSKEIHTELLKFDLYQLLMVKANLEKADKVNFLVDEEKVFKKFIIDKDTTSMLVSMIAILISLFALAINQSIIHLQWLFAFAIGILLILRFCFIRRESKRTSKPTNNKYKVFQYLVDIAIENKKKKLN